VDTSLILAASSAAKILSIIPLHSEPKKCCSRLRPGRFLLYPYNTCEENSITRSTAVNEISHHCDFDVVRKLAGGKIFRQLLQSDHLKIDKYTSFRVEL